MILNEHLLPNPFKQPGAELSNVLDNIERDLLARVVERDTTPLPAFLNDEFLERLEAEISAASEASAARKMQGRRIVSRLRQQLKLFGR
jgi:hypothetical protein